MMAKHPEDDVEVEETTPPTTPTHSSISTPLCHTLQTPKPTKDAAADKSVQTSVEATPAVKVAAETAAYVSTSATQLESPALVVPDYKQLYIDALLDQIETLKSQVKSQQDQIIYLQSSSASTTPSTPVTALSSNINTVPAKPQQKKTTPPPQAPVTPRANPPAKQTIPKQAQQKRVDIIGDSMLGGVRNWNKPEYME